MGDVCEVTQAAEEFASRPYAVNIFPIGTGKKDSVTVRVAGDVVCPIIKEGECEELLFRLYNPKNKPSEFTVQVGKHTIHDTVAQRAIVTVGFSDGKFTVYRDKTPV